MALLFIDGFDHYTTNAQLARKWDSAHASAAISVGNGRSGGNCLTWGFSNAIYIDKNVPNVADFIIGFAFKPAYGDYQRDIIALYNSVGALQLTVTKMANNTIQIRNDGGTVYGTGSIPVPTNVWSYVEIRLKPDGTTGAAQVRINGVLDVDFSGDTQYSTYTNDVAKVRLDLTYQAPSIDDVYICDGTGTANNTFLGDVSVATVYPDADSVNDWIATGAGTTNADRVDEATPDDDTTYVESATVAEQERYGYSAVPTGDITIHGVQVVPYAKKADDGGTRTVRTLAYSVATEAVGADVSLGVDYAYMPQVFETDPDAAAAWTAATVNAAEFGFEVVA